MQSPIVNEQERHVLHALLSKGSMTSEQLAELCKNAFGWSGAVIRRTKKSLLNQGLVVEQNGLLTPAVTREDLENNDWNQWVGSTFKWTPPARAEHKAQRFFKSIWFWSTCAACAVIAVLCVILFTKPPAPDNTPTEIEPTFPQELQVCKDALDAWQALDSYQIETTAYRYYNSKDLKNLSQWTETCWADGENWVYTNHAEKQMASSVLLPAAYMYRDGNLYRSFSAEEPIWTVFKPSTENLSIGYWPMIFDWDAHELMHLETTCFGDCDIVRFAVIDRSQEGQISLTEVQCNLTLSGSLNSITVIRSTNNTLYMDVYRLVSTDAIQISQFIADQNIAEISQPALPMD